MGFEFTKTLYPKRVKRIKHENMNNYSPSLFSKKIKHLLKSRKNLGDANTDMRFDGIIIVSYFGYQLWRNAHGK